MPGYVIHLAEAELILDKMRKLRQTDDAFEQAFLTGTLLPDTRLKGEKRFSHFWDPDKLECLALGPDLARFTDKYGQDTLTLSFTLKDPSAFGIQMDEVTWGEISITDEDLEADKAELQS